jgi:hypothetical protein
MKRALLLLVLVACDHGEHREAREQYNAGVDKLAAGDFDGAEKALLDALSNSGVDPELRFRANYDLGLAYASHADKAKTGKDADLAKALDLERKAQMWFNDAAKLRPSDADTRANLAIVRARISALSDELVRGEGKLEKRLDAVIKEQRSVLDEARSTWVAIKQAGAKDPLDKQVPLSHLADVERGVLAEAGVISDLADEEIDTIGKQPADKREQKDAARLVQLKNLDQFLLDGRTKITEARRKFQDLDAEAALARAEVALAALKRAREQLLDPIVVLREVARDELELVKETHAVAQVGGHKLLATGSGSATEPEQLIPAWLEPPALADRQTGLRDRVEEVRAQLAATIDNVDKPQGSGSDAEPPKLTPEQAKMIDELRQALPLVAEASADMDRAHAALGDKHLDDAAAAERDALIALAKAIEHFADLKQTIELAYATQQQLVALLSPEAAKQPAAERATETKDALAQNIARMERIKTQISDELAALDKQAQQPTPATGSNAPKPDPKQEEAKQEQLAQEKQRLTAAEALRADAAKALVELDAAIKANKDPLTPAKLGQTKLEELRRLFFSVIEHLQELVRTQGETRDQTAQANGEDDFTRGPKLPGLVQHEDEHAQMAKAISDALAAQADAAAKQGAQPPAGSGANAQPDAKALSEATKEVRLAQTDMTDAKGSLAKAQSTTQSVSLDPAVKSEGKAIEHLEAALKLLQPPSKGEGDDQKQQPQGGDKKQPQPPQQQGGAGQRARDDDANQRKKHQQQTEPVDKDW